MGNSEFQVQALDVLSERRLPSGAHLFSGFIVEHESKRGIYSSERSELREKSLELARKELASQGKNLDFYILVVERFEGLGAKYRLASRLKVLSSCVFISSEIFEISSGEQACLVYLVTLIPGWQEFVSKLDFNIGLVCLDPNCVTAREAKLAADLVFSDFTSSAVILHYGLAPLLPIIRAGVGLFYFSGAFDDSWSHLVVMDTFV
ncbi:hypothetical protein [Hydrogenophaga taeniospiralis]|uniref:hypothetical protein n=1 Tax=Hydrogenophaga taeniospiralis TaxID=65656 RepID=UPI000A667057|nr:hypothetical protein [Hydrogenophaga taeniospiralis]